MAMSEAVNLLKSFIMPQILIMLNKKGENKDEIEQLNTDFIK